MCHCTITQRPSSYWKGTELEARTTGKVDPLNLLTSLKRSQSDPIQSRAGHGLGQPMGWVGLGHELRICFGLGWVMFYLMGWVGTWISTVRK